MSHPAPLRLYTPGELQQFEEPTWLVEPFVPHRGLIVLFGPSGTYKTFLALDMAARAPGASVYISAEGSPRRFGQRVTAWERAACQPSGILCHPHAVDLLGDGHAHLIAALQALPEAPSLVVVDTTARNMPGADENSTQDMGRFVGAIDRLRAEFGCAVLVLHHTGHADTERERGSTALRGAADVSISVRRTAALEARLTCKKMRDAEEFEPLVVRLVPMDGTLVAAEARTPAESLDDEVWAYLSKHPKASQREVEKAIRGKTDDIRAAYKRVRPVRPSTGRTSEQGAPPVGAPTRAHQGARLQLVEDGGW